MIRVFCGMCQHTSDVEGAAMPRRCPSCNRPGAMHLARRTPVAEPDRTPKLAVWTQPLDLWLSEYRYAERMGLPLPPIKTERQRAAAEGRMPEPIGVRRRP
jgi:hypothetical protein